MKKLKRHTYLSIFSILLSFLVIFLVAIVVCVFFDKPDKIPNSSSLPVLQSSSNKINSPEFIHCKDGDLTYVNSSKGDGSNYKNYVICFSENYMEYISTRVDYGKVTASNYLYIDRDYPFKQEILDFIGTPKKLNPIDHKKYGTCNHTIELYDKEFFYERKQGCTQGMSPIPSGQTEWESNTDLNWEALEELIMRNNPFIDEDLRLFYAL